jgi:hypothetical protein
MASYILALTLFVPRGQAQAAVFEIAPVHSRIKFRVKIISDTCGQVRQMGRQPEVYVAA